MRKSTLVRSLRRGRTRSDPCALDSALYIVMALCPVAGKRAMKMTMMPRPPSQCVRLRQRSTPCGRASMSSTTVAPVPVKPDMLSKTPSR